MPIPNPEIRLPRRKPKGARTTRPQRAIRLRRARSGAVVVTGLDIQSGEIVATEVATNGGLSVRRAARAELPAGLVREGEVADPAGLGAELKRLFAEHKLPTRVRVGLAIPRSVVRTIDLPPLEDPKDIAAAVRMQAPEHIAMPLDAAVVDHSVLGLVQTPEGSRQRVVVAAAERGAVDRLIGALRLGGLRPVGIDLSAFALIRALHRPEGDAVEVPVLYADLGGLTTIAIAQGTICRFTRVANLGSEPLAEQLAARCELTLPHARGWLRHVGLERSLSDVEGEGPIVAAAREVLEGGVRALADDLRSSIDFFGAQHDAAPVGAVVVTGVLAQSAGVRDALASSLGTPVEVRNVAAGAGIDPAGLAVASGLAVEERPA